MSVDESHEASDDPTERIHAMIDSALAAERSRERIQRQFESLTPLEQRILKARFAVPVDGSDVLSPADRQRITAIEDRAARKLGRPKL